MKQIFKLKGKGKVPVIEEVVSEGSEAEEDEEVIDKAGHDGSQHDTEGPKSDDEVST